MTSIAPRAYVMTRQAISANRKQLSTIRLARLPHFTKKPKARQIIASR